MDRKLKIILILFSLLVVTYVEKIRLNKRIKHSAMRSFALIIFTILHIPLFSQLDTATPLPIVINSPYAEYQPLISADGQTFYFTRMGHPRNIGRNNNMDVWVSTRNDEGEWTKAINAGAPLNGAEDDVAIGMSTDGRKLYIFRKDIKKLLKSLKRGRSWQSPQKESVALLDADPQRFSMHLSFDGRILIISMPEPDGKAGNNLYMSEYLDDENRWTTPQDCGLMLNSDYDELYPFLAADNKTLYFASNRPNGYGGLDIYYSKRKDDTWCNWAPPRPLDATVNTEADEFSLTMAAEGTQAYFIRKNEDDSDIYQASLDFDFRPSPVILLKGQIKSGASGMTVPGTIEIRSPEFQMAIQALEADEEGNYQTILPYGTPLALSAWENGYLPVREPLPTAEQTIEFVDKEDQYWMASVQSNAVYAERDETINSLQRQLRILDDEVLELQKERKAYLESLRNREGYIVDKSILTDPELDALRHRYSQYKYAEALEQEIDTLPIPEAYDQKEMTQKDVEDMKTRYMRFYEYESNLQQAEENDAEEKNYIWNEYEDNVEAIEIEAVEELEEGLSPVVRQQLRRELAPGVVEEVKASLNPIEQQYFNLETETLQEQISEGFSNNANKNWTAKGQREEAAWEKALKQDVKNELRPQVESQLRSQLEEEVKDELKNDITYLAKKETQSQMQQELQLKLQQQMLLESQNQISKKNETDAVSPLIPLPESISNTPTGYQEVEKNLLLVPVEPGMQIELKTVGFSQNTAQLLSTAYPELSQLLVFLQKHSSLIVEIGAHTSSQLSHTNAQTLSRDRAQQIRAFLLANGIPQKRVVARGYGKSLPLVDSDTPNAPLINQRIEMRILE